MYISISSKILYFVWTQQIHRGVKKNWKCTIQCSVCIWNAKYTPRRENSILQYDDWGRFTVCIRMHAAHDMYAILSDASCNNDPNRYRVHGIERRWGGEWVVIANWTKTVFRHFADVQQPALVTSLPVAMRTDQFIKAHIPTHLCSFCLLLFSTGGNQYSNIF